MEIEIEIEVRKELAEDYRRACNAYLKAFCDMYELEYDEDAWTVNDPGTIASVSDYFVDMEVIRLAVDRNAPEKEFMAWYDYCLELGMLEIRSTPNFRSWLNGCPRLSEGDIANIKERRESLKEMTDRLMESIKG